MTPGASETSKTSAPGPPASADDELEKRKARAERFGIPLVESPKPKTKSNPAPAPAPNSAKAPDVSPVFSEPVPVIDTLRLQDLEKLKARAQRFGTDKVEHKKGTADVPAIGNKKRGAAVVEEVDPEEQERRRKRAERFGIPVVVRSKLNRLIFTLTLYRARRLDVLQIEI